MDDQTDPAAVIRPRTPDDDPAILATFNQVFGELWGAHYVPRTLAHLRWLYADLGLGDRAMLAHDERGRVLAFWGGVPLRVDSEFGPQSFVHSCDNLALATHRRTGLFVRLAQRGVEQCIAHGDAIGFGFPLPSAQHVDEQHLGTRELYQVEYLCLGAEVRLARPPAVQVATVHELGAEVDALYARTKGAYRCLARRDAAYFTWRYLACPSCEYRVLAARRAASLAGLAVLRPYHEILPGSCVLVDWLVPPDDHEVRAALLAAALDVARATQRTVLLTSFSPHSPERRALLELGFAAVSSRDTLAHPLVYLALNLRVSPEWLREHWWMTLGDSDLG